MSRYQRHLDASFQDAGTHGDVVHADAAGGDPDQALAGSRHWYWKLSHPERFGTTGSLDHEGLHGAVLTEDAGAAVARGERLVPVKAVGMKLQ